MKRPRICASITNNDLKAILEVQPDVDMFEVRLDLIGPKWTELITHFNKPWIACNRNREEGGKASGNEVERIEELTWAAEAGAGIIDIEFGTRNLKEIVPLIKNRAQCLISFHDTSGTPPYETLVQIVEGQIKSGADICKVVTTARTFADNLTVLKLIRKFPESKIIAFAMGEPGRISRILSPLVGGYLTYACIAHGRESASGQMTVSEIIDLYRILKNEQE